MVESTSPTEQRPTNELEGTQSKGSESVTDAANTEELLHKQVKKVRDAVKKQIRNLSLEDRIQYLSLLTMEIKSLTRSNQSQRSRKGAKGRPASHSY